MILGKLPLECRECGKVFLVSDAEIDTLAITCPRCSSADVQVAHDTPNIYLPLTKFPRRARHWAASAIGYRQSKGMDTPEHSFMLQYLMEGV